MFKGNNRSIKKRCEICSKLTIKTPRRRQRRRIGVFIDNFEHISYIFLLFLLLTLNKINVTLIIYDWILRSKKQRWFFLAHYKYYWSKFWIKLSLPITYATWIWLKLLVSLYLYLHCGVLESFFFQVEPLLRSLLWA